MSRRPFQSRPGLEPRTAQSEDVYQILERHEGDITELKDYAQKGELADAQIISKLTSIEATDRHATTKLISALVVTVITTIGGVIGTVAAMRPGAPPAPPQRSALDVKLDTCRPLPTGAGRAECFDRVFAGADH